jgi:hypothetical protein
MTDTGIQWTNTTGQGTRTAALPWWAFNEVPPRGIWVGDTEIPKVADQISLRGKSIEQVYVGPQLVWSIPPIFPGVVSFFQEIEEGNGTTALIDVPALAENQSLFMFAGIHGTESGNLIRTTGYQLGGVSPQIEHVCVEQNGGGNSRDIGTTAAFWTAAQLGGGGNTVSLTWTASGTQDRVIFGFYVCENVSGFNTADVQSALNNGVPNGTKLNVTAVADTDDILLFEAGYWDAGNWSSFEPYAPAGAILEVGAPVSVSSKRGWFNIIAAGNDFVEVTYSGGSTIDAITLTAVVLKP